MSYGIQAYRVDLQKIQQQYGTDNPDLKEKIMTSCQSQFEDLDGDFNRDEGWTDSEILMSDFLDGNWQDTNENTAKHWYMLELLIQGFGKILPNSQWYPASISPMWDYSEFQLYFLGANSSIPVSGPDDFPVVFTIERNHFDQALTHIREDYPDQDQQAEFASWIAAAREHDQDLVLYYY
jgi:hypothetical protein